MLTAANTRAAASALRLLAAMSARASACQPMLEGRAARPETLCVASPSVAAVDGAVPGSEHAAAIDATTARPSGKHLPHLAPLAPLAPLPPSRFFDIHPPRVGLWVRCSKAADANASMTSCASRGARMLIPGSEREVSPR